MEKNRTGIINIVHIAQVRVLETFYKFPEKCGKHQREVSFLRNICSLRRIGDPAANTVLQNIFIKQEMLNLKTLTAAFDKTSRKPVPSLGLHTANYGLIINIDDNAHE